MTTLHLDLETFSPVPITHGTHRYAEEAEVLLVALAVDDAPVDVWDTQFRPLWKRDLQSLIDDAQLVVIHNSAFDRTVLRHCGVNIPVEKIRDTMVQALAHSLPGSLGTLCDVLGVPTDKAKDKAGKKLIHLFTKPRPKNMKLRRADSASHPAEWAEFIEYARLDVDAMRDVYGRLPTWNNSRSERNLWRIDQRVNDRGIAIDLDLARSALRAFRRTSGTLATRAAALTNGHVTKLTQGVRFIQYLQDHHGFAIKDLTKGTVSELLRGNTLTPEVRELLEIRQQASATSPAKYKVLLDATSSDGRLRGTLQFCGASRTGRDAGRIFQPQNLPRPTMDADVIETGIAAMKLDCEDLMFNNVTDLCSSAVRGCLVAPEGRKLVIADLSNIEGRVLAWLAGEDWKVEAFYDFDRGVGHDLYVVAYATAFDVKPEEVVENKKSGDGSMRHYGKTMELAGGYGGGVGAYRTMGGPAVDKMSDEQIQTLVSAWRKAHSNVVQLWYGVERAAKAAIRNPDDLAFYDKLQFDVKDDWLRIKLPSGRYLSYRNAEIDDGRITFEGVNQYTKKWDRIETYGGKLCIAAGTPVLTHEGWLPIERVTAAHRVWDGVEWVSQKGLARNGIKGVISAHGVWMTPDHEILTTKGWVVASQSEGLDRAACRIPDGYEIRGHGRQEIPVASGVRLRDNQTDASAGTREAKQARRNSLVRLPKEGDYQREKDNSWHVEAQGFCRVAEYVRPLFTAVASGLGQLRRPWHKSVQSMAVFVSEFLGGHGANVRGWAYARPHKQQRRVLAGELPLGYAQAPSTQQTTECFGRHRMGSDYRCGSIGSLWYRPEHTALPPLGGRDGAGTVFASGHHAEVFDLVDCGPRNRFVVADENGQPLIVHNCENIVQAVARDVFMAGMVGAEEHGYEVCIRVHDELITEVPDTPEYNVEQLASIMATNPSWAVGLPLAAAGFETRRYKKD